MKNCPKCNHQRQEKDVECPQCGIVYKKYETYFEAKQRIEEEIEKQEIEKLAEKEIKRKLRKETKRKVITIIAIIWVAVIILFGLIEPEVSTWAYLIVGAPIIALSLLAIYVVGGATGSVIIDWIAETSDREKIKRTILNFVKIAIVFIILYFLLYLIGG